MSSPDALLEPDDEALPQNECTGNPSTHPCVNDWKNRQNEMIRRRDARNLRSVPAALPTGPASGLRRYISRAE